MEHSWIGEHEVRFGGAEGALTVRLGYGPAGTLVSHEARVEVGPLDGVVRAFLDLDTSVLRTQLRDVLGRADLTGDIRITGSEHGEFLAAVSLHRGRGQLRMKFESGFGLQDGGGTLVLTTDQSHLGAALRELEQALQIRR